MIPIAPLIFPVLLLFGFAAVVLMIAYARGSSVPGHRWASFLVVPLVVAAIMATALVAMFPGESLRLVPGLLRDGLATQGLRLPDSASWAAIGAAVLGAVTVVHFAGHELPGLATALWGRRTSRRQGREGSGMVADATRVVLLGGTAAATVLGLVLSAQVIAATERDRTGAEIADERSLAGGPTGFAVAGESIYISLGIGQIARLALDLDDLGASEPEVLVDGLTFPRTPRIVDDTLFVVDLGPSPCESPYPQCWTPEPAEELRRLNDSAGSVLAFDINPDGTLGERRQILRDLPVVNSEHAPNSLTVGPDGYLYLPIGGVDRLPIEPDLLDRVDHPNADLIGTIVRFRPDGSDFQTFATGIRNVYDLTFDGDGNLYGADNDGRSARGWRHEQLIHITQGADYGFPMRGTFELDSEAMPLWILESTASSGLEWLERGNTTGILVGGAGRIEFVEVVDDDGPLVLDRRSASVVLSGLGGFVTGIEPVAGGRQLISVFPLGGDGALMLVDLDT